MCYICCAHCCLCDIWEQMWLVMGATYYVPQWNKLSFLSHFIWRNLTRSSKSYLVLMENQKSVQLALSGSCENKNSVTRVWLQWFTLPESGFSLDKWLMKSLNWDCISSFWFWNVPTVTNTLCLQHQRHLSHGWVTAYCCVWRLVFFSKLSVRRKRAADWMSARMIPRKSVTVGNCHWAWPF